MTIHDITQELFSCRVYPGDLAPSFRRVSDMARGDACNVTELSMNAHNGTHADAPRHFVRDGKTIGELDPGIFVGPCLVADFRGGIRREDILPLRGAVRILARGDAWLDESGAEALSEIGAVLFGIEHQSIAGDNPPLAVHVALLSRGICALEGLVLSDVKPGEYFLSAAPLKLGGADGAPCRALLIEGIGEK